VGETRYTRWGGIVDASEHRLACEAIVAAVADAGLQIDMVDGLTSFAGDRNEAVLLAADLGLPELRFANMVWMPGGGGAAAAVANAALAVETGQAEVVVAFRSLCQGQYHRFGQGPGARVGHEPPAIRRAGTLLEAAAGFAMPFGALNAPINYALAIRRHMHRFGTTPAQLGQVAVTFRAHAARNPRAVMGHRPMTLGDHHASPMVADPLRLFDCCLETDGACAVVVTTTERARDCRRRPVMLLASAQGTTRGFGYGQFLNVNLPDDVYTSGGGAEVAARLWKRAGVGPADVDVAQIYDHFTGLVLLALEDYGFCGRGEGGPMVASGALAWPDGALPTNTHGGSLSEAYVHGLNHVVEGVRQLRGESTCPVADAEVCLVTSAAGVPTSALLLGRG
jgi:acetyl-CoA acetyltransferase